MIKPRIKKIPETLLWECFCDKHSHYSGSPLQAYHFWFRARYGFWPVSYFKPKRWWEFWKR